MRLEKLNAYSCAPKHSDKHYSHFASQSHDSCNIRRGAELKPALAADTFKKSNISFGSKRITNSGFSLVDCQTLPCPCCGRIMRNDPNRENCVTRIATSKGQKLVNTLNNNADKIRDGRKEVCKELKALALQNPELDLHGLLNTSYSKHLRALQIKQTQIIDNFFNTYPDANEDTKLYEMFNSFFNYQKALIKYATREGQFRNKAFKNELLYMCDSYNLNFRRSDIHNYFNQLPKSIDDKDAFFVKYARRGSHEIANILLRNNMPTIEHMEPFNKHHDNSLSNLMVMCSDCNNERDSTPYNVFIKDHPEMLENFEKYTRTARHELRLAKYHPKYDNYIDEIRNTFNSLVYQQNED